MRVTALSVIDVPRKVVFVGGAPRSGTTVTHALLCTAPGVSRYHPEISFFRAAPQAYRTGLATWTPHTSAFYPDPETFRLSVRETALAWLGQVARAVKDPPVLCVKDPHLTPLFPQVRSLLPEEAWFVTVCRHPYAVVRSRQQVHEKAGNGRPFGEPEVLAVAREYLTYYRTVLETDFGGRHYMFRYEDLGTERVRENLARFLSVEGFDLDGLWRTPEGDTPDPARIADDPWTSPKYYGGLDLEPRLPDLAPAWRGLVGQVCAPVMARVGYA